MSRRLPGLFLASLRRLLSGAAATARRFPAVVASGAVAGVAAVVALDPDTAPRWWHLWRVASLGIPLFVAIALHCERASVPATGRWIARGLGLAGLVVLHLLFERWEDASIPQRYGHLSATLHLAVAVVPYLATKGDESHGFWQFNRALFFRFLLATLYAGVIFLGLAVALAAIDNLFGVDIEDVSYPRLWMIVAFVFHPLFFLAGVPSDFAALARDRSYPVGLRVFCVYVMLPLVAVYVAILTAYMAKVLVTGTWPSGWISYLVSSLAVVGIFSLLMIHPERRTREGGWIDVYALAFWVAILPSAAMVLMAVWQRIGQYGVTERRYLLAGLAVWLVGIAVCAAATRTRRIRFIPLSLTVFGVLSFVGPWSAYAVAERSQLARLSGILTEGGALPDGRPSAETVEIPVAAWTEARAAVEYLVRHHGAESVAPVPADTAAPPQDATEEVARTMAALRVRPAVDDHPARLTASQGTGPVSVAGFDLVVFEDGSEGHVIDGDTARFVLTDEGLDIVMELGGDPVARASLAPLIDRARQMRARAAEDGVPAIGEDEPMEIAPDEMTLDLSGDVWTARLLLETLDLARVGPRMAGAGFRFRAALLRRGDAGL